MYNRDRMTDQFSRTELLLGKAAMEKLWKSRVAVFGLGGVGGHAAEALVRAGVGAIDLIDHDTVSVSNINRQLLATFHTVGQYKVDVAEKRFAELSPHCTVRTYKVFYLPETQDLFDFHDYDYIVDAIDTVTGKLALVKNAKACGTPIISAMGAGNKLDPTKFSVTDLAKTSVCPLARTMRRELKKVGIEHLKVVCSTETPHHEGENCTMGSENGRRDTPGSISFVPSAVGLILAGAVVRDLIG